ncbi:MAG: hypothetical protein JKY18_13680, partial [Flavobacteriales bacterium]|nr:hypothetical protein [Flavobacteriales bacterium]
GVVVSVFLLFYALPGDPARGLTGNHGDSLTIAVIRADLGLDQPLSVQFLSYINDLSPISVYNSNTKDHLFYLDPDDYTPYIKLYTFGHSKAPVPPTPTTQSDTQ